MTTMPETTAPAAEAEPDTAEQDLKICTQCGDAATFMPALEKAMTSEQETTRLVRALQTIRKQLVEIAKRHNAPRDETTRARMRTEMRSLCIAALQKAAPDGEVRKALATAINLALECAMTAAECRAVLGDASILDTRNDGQPSAPTPPRDVVAHHLPATPTQPSALEALQQLAAQAGTSAKTLPNPRSAPPPPKKHWWKFWGGGNNGKATSDSVPLRTRRGQSGAKPKRGK